LNSGVKEISAGNFGYQLPVKRRDELGDLAAAFNQMATRIEGMLKAKEQLMLDVSHELRSPLTRMKVALEFLPDGVAKTNLMTDIDEMERMVATILDTAKRHHAHSQLNWRKMSMEDLLVQVAAEFADRAPGVTLDPGPATAPLYADPARIKTVLRNIIDNAVKYSLPQSNPVAVSLSSTADQVIVCVKDSGTGIDPSELPYIFEPFYRIDKSRSKKTGGFGLGLSLCKSIIEAHKGKIEVDSVKGQGTVVKIFISHKPADGCADSNAKKTL
jgi:signal transduction histidine kinase